jgi:N6-adenosine-specific RNA methylase IME4
MNEEIKKLYGVIYADPPWQYDFAETDSRKIENHYPTMTLAEICCMDVPAAKDCVLYLWATAPKLLEAVAVMRAWGFSYKTHAMWDKELIGSGYWFRGQHELLMVATRGKVSPPVPELRIASVIRCKRGLHSRKPDYVRDRIEAWFPTMARLEMFTRTKRPGWEAFGNQVEHDLLSA